MFLAMLIPRTQLRRHIGHLFGGLTSKPKIMFETALAVS